jgi:hypothetical protein
VSDTDIKSLSYYACLYTGSVCLSSVMCFRILFPSVAVHCSTVVVPRNPLHVLGTPVQRSRMNLASQVEHAQQLRVLAGYSLNLRA